MDSATVLRGRKQSLGTDITIKDLSAMAARTNTLYSLFEKDDRFILVRHGLMSDESAADVVNKGYRWVGHAHPNDLLPSDNDYAVLRLLKQETVCFTDAEGNTINIRRLGDNAKLLVLGNSELVHFCYRNRIDLFKLQQCNIEVLGDGYYAFVLSREDVSTSKQLLPLDYDISSQPDVVLTLQIKDGKFKFKTTSKTKRVLYD